MAFAVNVEFQTVPWWVSFYLSWMKLIPESSPRRKLRNMLSGTQKWLMIEGNGFIVLYFFNWTRIWNLNVSLNPACTAVLVQYQSELHLPYQPTDWRTMFRSVGTFTPTLARFHLNLYVCPLGVVPGATWFLHVTNFFLYLSYRKPAMHIARPEKLPFLAIFWNAFRAGQRRSNGTGYNEYKMSVARKAKYLTGKFDFPVCASQSWTYFANVILST